MESTPQLVRNYNPASTALAAPDVYGTWQIGPPIQGYRADAEVRYRILLRRYAKAIVTIMLSCLAAALLITFLITPKYKAKSLVEVLPVNGDFMNNKDVDPNASPSGMDSYVDTQSKLLKSETVADRVVSSLLPKADQYSLEETGGFAKIRQWLGLQGPPPSVEAAVRRAIGSLTVKPEGQSSLISITVVSPSPVVAADTANAVANQHIEALQDARWATAAKTAEFLTGQLDALRKKLQASEDELQNYARTKGLTFTSDDSRESVAADKLRALAADLEKSEADRADKQSQMELINATSPDTLPRVLDDSGLREDKSRLTDLRRQLATLSATLTPNHYKVKEVQSQIDELEKQADVERKAVVTRLQNDYKAAQRREELQRKAYQAQLATVSDQASKEVHYNLLKSEVTTNRTLYQTLYQRIKEASVVAALRSSNIRVVDPAKTPGRPYQPNIILNVALGLLAGLISSVLLVLARERGDRTIRAPGESSRLLQVPELAIIPSARRDIRTQIVSAARVITPRVNRPSQKFLPATASSHSQEQLRKCLQDGSLVAESFRSAVTSILMWGRDRASSHKVLVITSAHSGAGKTTSVMNLGIGLVESGRRVLLIDGDLRLPRLGRIFALENADGLSNILADNLMPKLAKNFICETSIPNLYLLPSGPRQANAPQMLHSKALQTFIDEVRSDYDFILIDSPPAIPLTDVRLLARHADGVILVLRAGATSAEQSVTVRKCFAQDGTYIFGSILNDWNAVAEDPAYVNSYLKYSQPVAD